MDPIELGEMLIRLKGDSSKFDEMLNGAQKSAKETADNIKSTGNDLKSFQSDLLGASGGLQKTASDVLSKATSPTGLVDLIQQATKAAKDFDDAMEAVGEDLDTLEMQEEALGEEVSSTAAEYRKKIAAIQKYLPFSEEQLEQIKEYWDTVKGILTTVFGFIRDVLVGISKLVLATVETIRENWDSIKESIVAAWEWVYEQVEPIITTIREYAQSAMDNVAKFWKEKMSPITGFLVGLVIGITAAIELARVAFEHLAAWASTAGDAASTAGEVITNIWNKTIEVLNQAWTSVQDLAGALVTAASVMGGVALVVATLYGALRILMWTVRLLKLDVLALYSAKLLVRTATLLWATAVGTVNAAIAVHRGVMASATLAVAAYNAVMNIGQIVTAAFTAVVGFFKAGWAALVAVIQTVIAAIASLNIVLVALQGLGIVATLAVVAGAFLGVKAAIEAVALVVNNVREVFSTYMVMVGAFKMISAEVDLWIMTFKGLFMALKADMDVAWKLIVAMGKLASAQIQAYFDPVWEYIKSGFNAAWTTIADTFAGKMNTVLGPILSRIGTATHMVPGMEEEGQKIMAAATEARIQGFQQLQNAVSKGQKIWQDASIKFIKDFGAANKTDTVKNARKAVMDLLTEIESLEDPAEKAAKKQEETGKRGAAAAQAIANAYGAARAAIYGTLEAASRVHAYLETAFVKPAEAAGAAAGTGAGGGAPGTTVTPQPGRRNIKDLQDVASWRTQILDVLKEVKTYTRDTAFNTKEKPAVAGAP